MKKVLMEKVKVVRNGNSRAINLPADFFKYGLLDEEYIDIEIYLKKPEDLKTQNPQDLYVHNLGNFTPPSGQNSHANGTVNCVAV